MTAGPERSAGWVEGIEAASRYVPLALSPQCGFASTAGGNQLTVDDERRKLELVVGTASKVRGRPLGQVADRRESR